MARETKVGLLVGLAFIICFAVILANHGRQDGLQTQIPFTFVVDPRSHAPNASASPATVPAALGIPPSSVPVSQVLVRGPQSGTPSSAVGSVTTELAYASGPAGLGPSPMAGLPGNTAAQGDGVAGGDASATGQDQSLAERLRALRGFSIPVTRPWPMAGVTRTPAPVRPPALIQPASREGRLQTGRY